MKAAAFLIPFLSGAYLVAQEPETPLIRLESREVLVDAIVRDKGGRLVHGLTAADFDLREDGVVQKILSVEKRSKQRTMPGAGDSSVPAAAVRPASESSGRRVDALRETNLVTFVFDQLDPASRRLARQAALDMLKARPEDNTIYGVFVIQQSLRVLQQFTHDHASIRAAIERATGAAKQQFETAQNDIRTGRGMTNSAGNVTGIGGVGQSPPPPDPNAPVTPEGAAGFAAAQMDRMLSGMRDLVDTSDSEIQGRYSLYALLALAKSQEEMPGRKTMLYFSEGLALPNSLWHIMNAVISAANRANVSIYTFDARGLLTTSDLDRSRALLAAAGANNNALYNSVGGSGAVTRGESMATDSGLDSTRANVQAAIRELAESTGGFLAANTNDLRVPIRRLAEELSEYYEITYRPSNNEYDGEFRKIDLRVKRNGLHVQARGGYFALPSWAAHVVFPFEVPLLKALNTQPLRREVPYKAAAFRFRPGSNETQVAVVLEAPYSGIDFKPEPGRNDFRSHVVAIAVLREPNGRVRSRSVRDMPLRTAAEAVESSRKRELLIIDAMPTPPGRYVLETAVSDQQTNRIGAHRSVFLVPAKQGGVGLSSVSLVRRVEKSSEIDLDQPFHIPSGHVIPMLADRVKLEPGKPLPFYFIVYPMQLEQPPRTTIEVLADTTPVAKVRPQLPEALEDGSIRYVGSMPLDKLGPGLHEIRITVEQGGTTAIESLFVTLE